MSPEASRLLVTALRTLNGKSWGPKFDAVLQELAEADCPSLTRTLVAAGCGDQAAWRELCEAAGAAKGPALLDVVSAFSPPSSTTTTTKEST